MLSGNGSSPGDLGQSWPPLTLSLSCFTHPSGSAPDDGAGDRDCLSEAASLQGRNSLDTKSERGRYCFIHGKRYFLEEGSEKPTMCGRHGLVGRSDSHVSLTP